MSKFRHHEYTWKKPFGNVRHSWQVIGPAGGVHFHASVIPQFGPSCGLEFHHSARTRYRCDEAPDHINCWLTGEPCWHDGTSLYATETLWPQIEAMLFNGNQEAIFLLLEWEYEQRFASVAAYDREASEDEQTSGAPGTVGYLSMRD